MNNGDREYFDSKLDALANEMREASRSQQAEIRTGSQALNQVSNCLTGVKVDLSAVKATVDSLPVRCDERSHCCGNRFDSMEQTQSRIIKYTAGAICIILTIITGIRFI